MDWIYGKTILITGASSGLGRAMTLQLILSLIHILKIMYRDNTKVIRIGNKVIGGGNPIMRCV